MARQAGKLSPCLTPRRDAQALLELAITMPIMLLMALAVVDFGRGFYAGVTLEGAAREGARYAAANRCVTPAACSAQESALRARVLQAIGPGDPMGISSAAALPACPSDPPPAAARPCVAIASYDRSGGVTNIRDDGYTVRVRVYAGVLLVTSFLAEGVDGLAPGVGGLCYQLAGGGKVCRIPVAGEAYMVVL